MKFNYKTILSALAAVSVSGSAMGQSADLTMKWKADLEYKVKQSIDLNMTMPKPQGGGEMVMKMVMGMKGASSDDAKGTVVDMRFDNISMNMNMAGNYVMSYDSTKPNPDGPMDKAMAPLLDLKFKTLYGKDGKFIELQDFDEKILKPEMGFSKGSIESMMKQQSQMIPHREVKVGEVWKATLITPMQGFEDGLSCKYDFKLASVEEVEGKRIARIDFTAEMSEMKMKQNGLDMTMNAKNIEGYFLFDVKDGQFTESEAFFNMVANVQNMDMNMQMKMKMEFSNKPLKK